MIHSMLGRVVNKQAIARMGSREVGSFLVADVGGRLPYVEIRNFLALETRCNYYVFIIRIPSFYARR